MRCRLTARETGRCAGSASTRTPSRAITARSAGPAGPWMGPAQHGDLMPRHQEPGVLGGRWPAEQDKPAAEADEDEIRQAERADDNDSLRLTWSSLQLTGHADFWYSARSPGRSGGSSRLRLGDNRIAPASVI